LPDRDDRAGDHEVLAGTDPLEQGDGVQQVQVLALGTRGSACTARRASRPIAWQTEVVRSQPASWRFVGLLDAAPAILERGRRRQMPRARTAERLAQPAIADRIGDELGEAVGWPGRRSGRGVRIVTLVNPLRP